MLWLPVIAIALFALGKVAGAKPMTETKRDIDINHPAIQAWKEDAEELIPQILPHHDSDTVDRILTWIGIESGGNPCSLDAYRKEALASGHVPDVGPMQLYFSSPTTRIHGYTSAQLREGCDGVSQHGECSPQTRRLQLKVSLQWLADEMLVQDAKLNALGIHWSERDKWRWYKFSTHGLPAVALCMLPLVFQQLGRPPMDWKEFRSTCYRVPVTTIQAAAKSPEANGCTGCLNARHLWDKAFTNAEEMDLKHESDNVV